MAADAEEACQQQPPPGNAIYGEKLRAYVTSMATLQSLKSRVSRDPNSSNVQSEESKQAQADLQAYLATTRNNPNPDLCGGDQESETVLDISATDAEEACSQLPPPGNTIYGEKLRAYVTSMTTLNSLKSRISRDTPSSIVEPQESKQAQTDLQANLNIATNNPNKYV